MVQTWEFTGVDLVDGEEIGNVRTYTGMSQDILRLVREELGELLDEPERSALTFTVRDGEVIGSLTLCTRSNQLADLCMCSRRCPTIETQFTARLAMSAGAPFQASDK
jgi:hypothetical protein